MVFKKWKVGARAVCTAALIAAGVAGTADIAYAEGAGSWLVRARAIAIVPDESSSISGIGGEVDISNEVVPELDFTYFITDNIATELILATAKHDADAEGTALNNLALGDFWIVPPTWTLQYHFMPGGQFRPYVGAGVTYVLVFAEDAAGGVVTDFEVDNGFGAVLQAGMDYDLGDGWLLNVDLKRTFVNLDASVNSGAINADIDLDHFIVGAGIGYQF